jgi:hypothetical protein
VAALHRGGVGGGGPPDLIIKYNSSKTFVLASFMVLYNTNIKYNAENVVFHAANIPS